MEREYYLSELTGDPFGGNEDKRETFMENRNELYQRIKRFRQDLVENTNLLVNNL